MKPTVITIKLTDEFHGTKTTMFARETKTGWEVSKTAFNRAVKRLCPAPKECRCGIKAFTLGDERLVINHWVYTPGEPVVEFQTDEGGLFYGR